MLTPFGWQKPSSEIFSITSTLPPVFYPSPCPKSTPPLAKFWRHSCSWCLMVETAALSNKAVLKGVGIATPSFSKTNFYRATCKILCFGKENMEDKRKIIVSSAHYRLRPRILRLGSLVDPYHKWCGLAVYTAPSNPYQNCYGSPYHLWSF